MPSVAVNVWTWAASSARSWTKHGVCTPPRCSGSPTPPPGPRRRPTEQRARADAAQEQASDARAAHTEMIAELAAARQRVEDEHTHTQTRLADQRAGYEDRLTELRTEIDKLRAQKPGRNTTRGTATD